MVSAPLLVPICCCGLCWISAIYGWQHHGPLCAHTVMGASVAVALSLGLLPLWYLQHGIDHLPAKCLIDLHVPTISALPEVYKACFPQAPYNFTLSIAYPFFYLSAASYAWVAMRVYQELCERRALFRAYLGLASSVLCGLALAGLSNVYSGVNDGWPGAHNFLAQAYFVGTMIIATVMLSLRAKPVPSLVRRLTYPIWFTGAFYMVCKYPIWDPCARNTKHGLMDSRSLHLSHYCLSWVHGLEWLYVALQTLWFAAWPNRYVLTFCEAGRRPLDSNPDKGPAFVQLALYATISLAGSTVYTVIVHAISPPPMTLHNFELPMLQFGSIVLHNATIPQPHGSLARMHAAATNYAAAVERASFLSSGLRQGAWAMEPFNVITTLAYLLMAVETQVRIRPMTASAQSSRADDTVFAFNMMLMGGTAFIWHANASGPGCSWHMDRIGMLAAITNMVVASLYCLWRVIYSPNASVIHASRLTRFISVAYLCIPFFAIPAEQFIRIPFELYLVASGMIVLWSNAVATALLLLPHVTRLMPHHFSMHVAALSMLLVAGGLNLGVAASAHRIARSDLAMEDRLRAELAVAHDVCHGLWHLLTAFGIAITMRMLSEQSKALDAASAFIQAQLITHSNANLRVCIVFTLGPAALGVLCCFAPERALQGLCILSILIGLVIGYEAGSINTLVTHHDATGRASFLRSIIKTDLCSSDSEFKAEHEMMLNPRHGEDASV